MKFDIREFPSGFMIIEQSTGQYIAKENVFFSVEKYSLTPTRDYAMKFYDLPSARAACNQAKALAEKEKYREYGRSVEIYEV